MVSHKYAEFGSARVIKDLAENHGRAVARCFVQDVADAVAAVALAKEEDWEYALPELEEPTATITIGMDGTCLLMCEGGWRETMVGTIGFYDAEGERQHTIYLGATPEYGKATFLDRMEREIERVKAAYPQARYVGLADGAKGNWELPGPAHRGPGDRLLACRRVPLRCGGCPLRPQPRGEAAWLEASCHRLKHEPGAARQLIRDLKRLAAEKGVPSDQPEVEAAMTYFTNQSKAGRMDYPPLVESNDPDRQRGDGGGVQGAGEAAAVRLGDEVEGAGCGGGAEPAVPDLHDGALVAVLGEDRPVRVPRGGLTITSF